MELGVLLDQGRIESQWISTAAGCSSMAAETSRRYSLLNPPLAPVRFAASLARTFQIKLKPLGAETVVHVNHRFPDKEDPDQNPFRLVSSCVEGPRLGEEFEPAIRRRVDRRLRARRGRRKGRVLYVLANQDPVAALAFHVPADDEEPVCVLGAGAADWVEDRLEGGALVMIAYLRECALAINKKLERGARLAWATDSDDTERFLHKSWGFKAVARKEVPRGISERHYLLYEEG